MKQRECDSAAHAFKATLMKRIHQESLHFKIPCQAVMTTGPKKQKKKQARNLSMVPSKVILLIGNFSYFEHLYLPH